MAWYGIWVGRAWSLHSGRGKERALGEYDDFYTPSARDSSPRALSEFDGPHPQAFFLKTGLRWQRWTIYLRVLLSLKSRLGLRKEWKDLARWSTSEQNVGVANYQGQHFFTQTFLFLPRICFSRGTKDCGRVLSHAFCETSPWQTSLSLENSPPTPELTTSPYRVIKRSWCTI